MSLTHSEYILEDIPSTLSTLACDSLICTQFASPFSVSSHIHLTSTACMHFPAYRSHLMRAGRPEKLRYLLTTFISRRRQSSPGSHPSVRLGVLRTVREYPLALHHPRRCVFYSIFECFVRLNPPEVPWLLLG